MPRQKTTKRIDPTRARDPNEPTSDDEPHNVFKVSGSPIISPRAIRHCLEEPTFGIEPEARTLSNGGVVLPHPPMSEDDAAAIEAEAAEKALEQEQAASTALRGLSGVQLVVHHMLATHTHTLKELGVSRRHFPNTKLSLKQIETMLRPVLTFCNVLRAEHFGLHVPTPEIARTINGVHYWKLWESDSIDIGIFIIPPNGTIPLHNHPGMSVVTRVLYGAAHVTSYDVLSDAEVQTLEAGSEIRYQEETFSIDAIQPGTGSISWARISRQGQFKQGTTTWLDPRRFNLHNIQGSPAIGCAVLDVMVPPYENANRECHHFKILEHRTVHKERLVKMLESPQSETHSNPPTSSDTIQWTPPSA